ncbi:hypothetical protein [Streptomyces omiyaensis]|uniref:hypothetical protein n=1 Tax=Streptomyces omiyaensis TaxID=68247 RepID=UPI00370223FE
MRTNDPTGHDPIEHDPNRPDPAGSDPDKLETTLPDGRRMTLSLPAGGTGWAADGVAALRPVRPTHTGCGEEPPALPEGPALPLEVALLGFAL